VLDAAKVGAQLAAAFQQPQLLFFGIPFLSLLAVGRRPVAKQSG